MHECAIRDVRKALASALRHARTHPRTRARDSAQYPAQVDICDVLRWCDAYLDGAIAVMSTPSQAQPYVANTPPSLPPSHLDSFVCVTIAR